MKTNHALPPHIKQSYYTQTKTHYQTVKLDKLSAPLTISSTLPQSLSHIPSKPHLPNNTDAPIPVKINSIKQKPIYYTHQVILNKQKIVSVQSTKTSNLD